jgi:hypothetical protein
MDMTQEIEGFSDPSRKAQRREIRYFLGQKEEHTTYTPQGE